MQTPLIHSVSNRDWQHTVLQSRQPVLVDFWADWCGPCKMLEPQIERLAESHANDLQVVRLNVDENPSLAEQYHVFSIPTLIMFRDGKPAKVSIGVQTAEMLEERFGLTGAVAAASN